MAPEASIADISLSNLPPEKYLEFEKHVRDRCGTPGFWPPELVTQLCALQYAFKMDVFSAGVTLYRMLCNEMPFGIFESWKYSVDHRDGQKKLCKVKPNWKVISWIQNDNKYTPVLSSRKLTDSVKDLLRSMLRIRPEQRATVNQCLQHDFFNKKGLSSSSTKPTQSNSNSNSKQRAHGRHRSSSRPQNHGHGAESNGNNAMPSMGHQQQQLHQHQHLHHHHAVHNAAVMNNGQYAYQQQQQQHPGGPGPTATMQNRYSSSNIRHHRKKRPGHASNSNLSSSDHRKFARSTHHSKMKAKG